MEGQKETLAHGQTVEDTHTPQMTFSQWGQSWVIPIQQPQEVRKEVKKTDTKLLNVTPAGGAIPDYWLYLSCWWISNNSGHSRSKNSHPWLLFAVFCFFEYLSASHRGADTVVCILNFLRLLPLKHLLRLREGIDSPQGEGKCVTLRRLDW